MRQGGGEKGRGGEAHRKRLGDVMSQMTFSGCLRNTYPGQTERADRRMVWRVRTMRRLRAVVAARGCRQGTRAVRVAREYNTGGRRNQRTRAVVAPREGTREIGATREHERQQEIRAVVDRMSGSNGVRMSVESSKAVTPRSSRVDSAGCCYQEGRQRTLTLEPPWMRQDQHVRRAFGDAGGRADEIPSRRRLGHRCRAKRSARRITWAQ